MYIYTYTYIYAYMYTYDTVCVCVFVCVCVLWHSGISTLTKSNLSQRLPDTGRYFDGFKQRSRPFHGNSICVGVPVGCLTPYTPGKFWIAKFSRRNITCT